MIANATVMLLIDGDNVSMDVVEQAVPWVHKHYGGPHVRRAYCTAESAVRHQGAFKRLGIRPMVNLAAGKNSTDIALAVDAIDLAVSERPQVIVIASSDSDFAPLVSRLREKGCRVVGIGQSGKTGSETVGVYDDYEVLVHRKSPTSSPAAAPAPAPAAKKPARKTSRKTAAKAAAKSAARSTHEPVAGQPAKKSASAGAADKLGALLAALPELAEGRTLDLNVAVKRLREAKLLGKSASSLKLFAQFPEVFDLAPPSRPSRVTLLKPTNA